MNSDASQRLTSESARFADAWSTLRNDPSVQFGLTAPQPPPEPPAWLEAIGRFVSKLLEPIGWLLSWVGHLLPAAPYARIMLWAVLVLGAALLAWAIVNRIRHGEWRLRPARTAPFEEITGEDEWAPDGTGARSWLEEADKFANEGRFDEAIHHLLFRSVDDIAKRRPALVRPALTSRELASSQFLPARARTLFSDIAELVERSLFGARPVVEADWIRAREAYSNFALASAWRG